MKKKILALTLVVLLICAMALPASAATYYWNGTYEGESFEVSETCTIFKFEGSVFCSSMEPLQVTARVYGWTAVIGPNGISDIIDAGDNVYVEFQSDPCMSVAGIKMVEPNATICQVRFTYTVGGEIAYMNFLGATAV